jgi:hypothetical protein
MRGPTGATYWDSRRTLIGALREHAGDEDDATRMLPIARRTLRRLTTEKEARNPVAVSHAEHA